MTGWQDISTAPKDGTLILVCLASEVGGYFDGHFKPKGRVHIAHFGARDYWQQERWILPYTSTETFNGSEYTGSWNETENAECEPTAWMPLPTPPGEG